MRQIGKAYSDLSHSMMVFRLRIIMQRYDHIGEARTAVYMHVVVPEYKNRKIYAYILRKLNIYFEQDFLYSVIVTVHFR